MRISFSFLFQELIKMADVAVATPADKKAAPKFKQRTVRTFKSKAPKPGQKGWEGFNISKAKYKKLFFILPGKAHVLNCLSLYSSDLFCLALRVGDDIPGMEGLGTDITVICPWEAFGDMELNDLSKYGII